MLWRWRRRDGLIRPPRGAARCWPSTPPPRATSSCSQPARRTCSVPRPRSAPSAVSAVAIRSQSAPRRGHGAGNTAVPARVVDVRWTSPIARAMPSEPHVSHMCAPRVFRVDAISAKKDGRLGSLGRRAVTCALSSCPRPRVRDVRMTCACLLPRCGRPARGGGAQGRARAGAGADVREHEARVHPQAALGRALARQLRQGTFQSRPWHTSPGTVALSTRTRTHTARIAY